MRWKYFLIFVLLLALVPSVSAYIGVVPPSEPTFINFKPNFEVNYTIKVFGVTSTTDIVVYSEGDLNETITFDKDRITSQTGHILTATLRLPDAIEKPGPHKLFISIQTLPAITGPINPSEKVQIPIIIFVPYPGKYIEANFNVDNVNLGEEISFIINLINRGSQDLNTVYATVDIYDSRDVKLKTLETERAFMKSGESKDFLLKYNSNNLLGGGTYKAIATVNYDGETQKLEGSFRVGILTIDILNHTYELKKDAINKFNIEIQSNWNDRIEGIYAKVKIGDKETETPTTGLDRFAKDTLTAFFDTTGLEKGIHEVNVSVFYDKNRTTSKISQVKIIEEFKINMTMVLTAVIIIIVLIDIIWLIISKRKKKKNE